VQTAAAMSSRTDFASRFSALVERRAGAILVLFLLITTGLGLSLRRLALRTSFEDLLPKGQPSVVALHQIMNRMGSMGTLNVVIQSSHPEASKHFAKDLVAALQTKMAGDLQSVDYTVAPIRRFYEKNGVLYLSKKELQELDRTLADAIRQAKLKANPLYMDMEDDDENRKDPAKQLRAIEGRLRDRASAIDRFPDGHYVGEQGRLLAIFLSPRGSALEVDNARALIGKAQRVVDELRPQRYDSSLKVNFTGSIQIAVEEHESIVRDLAGTSLLCLALVALAVWLYFRRARMLALLGVTLVAGAVWAFGIAALTWGFVNAQTAFLGSIIVGTGINYGILILARYLEERRNGAASSPAMTVALRASFKPTLVAALATGLAFGGLSIAHIASFSQFGVIGGVGIVICWALSYTVVPALVALTERVSWLRLRVTARPRFQLSYPAWLARLPVRHALPVVIIAAVLVGVGAVQFAHFVPRSLETDINALRIRQKGDGTRSLDERVTKMMGDTLNTAVILADSPEQARRVCQTVDRQIGLNPKGTPFGWCRTMHSFLPEDQDAKLPVVARIRDRLDRTPRGLLPDSVRQRVEEMRSHLGAKKLAIGDLPEEIRRRFREKSGTEGTVALVTPRAGMDIWSVEGLYAFTDALREFRIDSGETVRSSGHTVVFADILRIIGVDAPKTTLLAALGVILMLIVVLRRGRPVAKVLAALVAGLTWMVGIAAAMGIKFNFFNFVALPTTFGIGVDYPINIQQRHEQDGAGTLEHALRRTGPAVFVASMTTIIGYAVLLTSESLVLVSFGKLAIIGEFTCLVAALLFLPAMSALAERRTAPVTVPVPQPASSPEEAAAHALGLASVRAALRRPTREGLLRQARHPGRTRAARGPRSRRQ
jgi:uncharacterized protein